MGWQVATQDGGPLIFALLIGPVDQYIRSKLEDTTRNFFP